MSERRCTVPGCDERHLAKGLCSTHYDRVRSRGTTDPHVRIPHLDRVLARIEKRPTGFDSPCWDPGYARTPQGYCKVKLRPNPVPQFVHRFLYEQMVGPIPEGLQLDHLCRNRWCCNPAHLEPVTAAVNIHRGTGWAPRFKRQTHCIHGHEFTPENTRRAKNGGRECKACNTIRARKRYQKTKEKTRG